MYARMYARASDCGQIIIRTHDRNRTTGTHDNRKREEHQQAEKPEYICMIADNEKKVQKKVKKNLEIAKKAVSL